MESTHSTKALRGLLTTNLLFVVLGVGALGSNVAQPADPREPRNLPNPYRAVENSFRLAEGRWWGSVSALDVDVDGRSIWVVDQCGAATCAGSKLNPILRFDPSGRLVRRFGEGLFILPHGIHVDRDGNVWVTDIGGHAVYKFDPDGHLLLILGKPGVAGDGMGPLLSEPYDVVTAANGDVFVADGHGSEKPGALSNTVARIARFTREGTFVKSWGTPGSDPGEFRTPHGLAIDSHGRLFVADRGNNRIQIFDQEGRFLRAWKQFGRASGIVIDKGDTLYAADAQSSEETNPGWKPGIRIGSATEGRLTAFVPDRADAVAVDALGNIYAAVVDGGALGPTRFVPRLP